MDRRTFLRTLGVVGAAGVAGCGGGGGETTPTPTATPSLQQVSVSAPNMSKANSDFTLEVTWNAATVEDVTTQGGETLTPRSGEKIVVVALEVTTPSDREVSLRPGMWRLAATSFRYEPLPSDDDSYFPETTAEPGSTTSGWLAYSIPDPVFNAQFVLAQNDTEAAIDVRFTKDEELDIPPL